MLEKQHLTDDMIDAVLDAFEDMKSKGVLYRGATCEHSWPKIEFRSIRVYKNPATGVNGKLGLQRLMTGTRLTVYTEPIFLELGVSPTFDLDEAEEDPHDAQVIQEVSEKLEDSLRRLQAGKEASDNIPAEVRKLLAAQ